MTCPHCYHPLESEIVHIDTHRGTITEHHAWCDGCGWEAGGMDARRAYEEEQEAHIETWAE